MARWDGYNKNSPEAVANREAVKEEKRATEKVKKKAASAANPKPRRKAKPVRAASTPKPEPQPKRNAVTDAALIVDRQALINALRNFREVRDAAKRADKAREISKKTYGDKDKHDWIGYGTKSGIESHVSIEKELRLEAQAKLAQAESEKKWWQEIEALVSQAWDKERGKGVEHLVDTVFSRLRKLAEAEPELKRRRKRFDAEHPKRVIKAKASDDPLEKVRELVQFLRWYAATHPIATHVKPTVLSEIERLEKLVDTAKTPDR